VANYFQIIWHLVKFLSVEELVNTREVSTNWNQLVSERLRVSSHPLITFNTDEKQEAFVSRMASRIQRQVPFGKFGFSLTPQNQPILLQPFLSSIGIYVKSCFLKFRTPPTGSLSDILMEMPQLESLSLCGKELRLNWIQFPSSPNSKLKSLTILRRCYCTGSQVHGELTLEMMRTWIEQTKLEYFSCGARLPVVSPTGFQEFLQSLRHLRSLTLSPEFQEGSTIPAQALIQKLPPLFLHVQNENEFEGGLISGWLEMLSTGIQFVHLKVRSGSIQISSLQLALHCLCVSFKTIGGVGQVEPSHFPALKTVWLCFSRATENGEGGNYFRNAVMPSVDALFLRNAFDVNGNGHEPWHSIFPNVKRLYLEGQLERALKFNISNFSRVNHLILNCSSPNTSIANIIFKQCPISMLIKAPLVDIAALWLLAGLTGKTFQYL